MTSGPELEKQKLTLKRISKDSKVTIVHNGKNRVAQIRGAQVAPFASGTLGPVYLV